MSYRIVITNKFSKDLKVINNRGCDIEILKKLIGNLANDIQLDMKCKDHIPQGKYKGYRECHILPDWLLIYKEDKKESVLYLIRTGTHSDLF